MKIDQKNIAIFLVLIIDCLVGCFVFTNIINDKVEAKSILNFNYNDKINNIITMSFENIKIKREEDIRLTSIVYDNMTIEQLSNKLEKSMNSSLKGKGKLFASYSIELGLDPYLALAIVLHETGCSYNCSGLVQTHNNIGGLKGSNGKYLYFNSLDEGIIEYLKIFYNNYYSKGLTTPELINPKYASSTTWANKINWYMKKIKAK